MRSFILASLVVGLYDYENNHYFAIKTNPVDAPQIAENYGFEYHGNIGELRNYFMYSTPKGTSAHHLQKRLESSSLVEWVEKQEPRQHLYKRDLVDDARQSLGIQDPGLSQQWHLVNTGTVGYDLNVVKAWQKNITGTGVTVAFIDDGLDHENPDLKDNFSALGSYDFNAHRKLPTPTLSDDTHGTRCAGEVAAVKNDVCGVGVAYTSQVAGIRILSGTLTDADEAASVNYAMNTTQIYSCSWGPRDDGQTMEAPPQIVQDAIENGILNGRQGLGSVFVFAAGNGGAYDDNCNFDGYTNSIYTITVAAMDRNQNHPPYSERCPAILAATYSSSSSGFQGIYTTDWQSGCTSSHGGTSAAAPLAAGVYALVLSARADLSWRDLQRLTIENAVVVNPKDEDWIKNGFGRLYSIKYGYGGYDADKLIEAAKTFKNVGPQTKIVKSSGDMRIDIPQGEYGIKLKLNITANDIQELKFKRLEHVVVSVSIEHQRRGDIKISLISPSKYTSVLVDARPRDGDKSGYKNWKMLSVAFWDEPAEGDWWLSVIDSNHPEDIGAFKGWNLTLYGEQDTTLPVTTTTIESVTATASASATSAPQEQVPVPATSYAFPIAFLVTLALVAALGLVYIQYKRGKFRKRPIDDYSEFEHLAAFDDGDFDALALNDLDLPRSELIFNDSDE